MDGSLTPELIPSQPLQSTAPSPAPKNSSWTSWALSLIPTVSVGDDNDGLSEDPESSNRNFDVTRANTFGIYARKLYLTFTVTWIFQDATFIDFYRSLFLDCR